MRLKVPKTEKRKSNDARSRHVLRRVIISVVAMVLLALSGLHILGLITGNAALSTPESVVSRVVTPIQTGFSALVDGVVNYLYKLKLRSTIELAYNDLRQENERLVYQAMLSDELQHKLQVYENLYDEISINESMNPLVATVIGRASGNYFSVFTINKGSNDGIAPYMAVTMGGAMIGYTDDVSATKSVVRTIIDSEASIASLISSSRDQGTVRGTLGIDGQPMCRMYYLPEAHLPRPGDIVVTSGVGMSFPKGIPIGTVRESTRGMESNKQYIVVEPQADFEHIEYVIVLRYQPVAEAVENRASSNDSLSYTALTTIAPIPTIQIGSDFYQLAPTPEPTPEPSVTPPVMDGSGLVPTLTPPSTPSGNYEYQVPTGGQTNNSFGYTLPPTATPSPTPPPLDISVEEDE